jgi:copper(I)-binding protein
MRFFVLASFILLLAACMQPAASPAGLQIVDPWARQAKMTTDPPATDAVTTAISAPSKAMTATTPLTATMSMSGNMGMGMAGAMGAVYMTIRNPDSQPDRLVKARTDAAKAVELHTVSQDKNGIMAMHPADGIDVPANGEATLQPGGMHIMLIGLTRDLNVGDQVTVTLTFAKAGDRAVTAIVRER